MWIDDAADAVVTGKVVRDGDNEKAERNECPVF